MKSISFLIILFVSFFYDTVLRERVSKVNVTNLPFELTNSTSISSPVFAVSKDLANKLSLHVYRDFGGQKKIWNDDVTCFIYKRFNTGNKHFTLLDVCIELSDFDRHLLVSLNTEGQLVDTLEVGIGSTLLKEYALPKQYCLDGNFKIVVSQLKIVSEEIVEFYPDLVFVNAQRIDIYYFVDGDGKFVKEKEIRYTPRTYKMEELYQKGHGIWNGTETPVEREDE